MAITKFDIVKAVEQVTGIKPELHKDEGSYYWRGEAASLFSDSCLYITSLNHPKVTIEMFVSNFKEKIAEVELDYLDSISNILKSEVDSQEPPSFSL